MENEENLLNKDVISRVFSIFFILSLTPILGLTQELVPIEGELQIPEDYQEQKERLEERDQVIPHSAAQATSPGSFSGKILEYHFAQIIENNQFKPLESMKSLENAVNNNTNVDTKIVKVKTKLDVNRLKAQLDIESFVNTKVWTENSFKTLRAQMKLYEYENALLSVENKTNREDTRTYINLQKTW